MGADPVRARGPGQRRGGRGHPAQRVPCRRGGRSGGRRRCRSDGRPPSAHRSAPDSAYAERPGIRPTAMGTGTAAGQRTAVGPGSRAAPWRNGIAAQTRADAPGTAVLGRAGRGCLAGRSPWRVSASTGLVIGRRKRWRPSRAQHCGCSGDGSHASWSADACCRPSAAPARCSGASAADPRTPRPPAEPGCLDNALARGSVRASTGRRPSRPPWSRFGILPGQQADRSPGEPTC